MLSTSVLSVAGAPHSDPSMSAVMFLTPPSGTALPLAMVAPVLLKTTGGSFCGRMLMVTVATLLYRAAGASEASSFTRQVKLSRVNSLPSWT
ncbi:MAG: hypothetical protein AW10_00314 [Candidatus Accumulibacter appositus]|uniref:Uncharacterized protein n=1 Tax=Candidatus Accumulibacter appositus TaxID=1454003 RepID=A0A011QVE6_9PROT|nr:MAG: hypothetical protein AW10_00314 [Candidatus Accumulibacter appositus]